MPRLDARWPGLLGIGGARELWKAAPRVAMAVGNTLHDRQCRQLAMGAMGMDWKDEQ